jgi:predicted small lipoprotein YifL
MARRVFIVLALVALAFFSHCGKKGPLLPPIIRVPQTAQDLSLSQRGAQVLVSWTNPTAYVDGNPLDNVSEVEIWLLREGKAQKSPDERLIPEAFEQKASLLDRVRADEFPSLRLDKAAAVSPLTYGFRLESEDFGRTVLTFALRVRDERQRPSEFSVPVSFEVRIPPLPPENVRAAVSKDNITVHWDPPPAEAVSLAVPAPAAYNVYRSEAQSLPSRLNDRPVKDTEFQDKVFSFGRIYRYWVRSVVTESPPFIESEESSIIEVEAKDVFPPAAPAGLTAIAGAGFIVLSWEANAEADLAGYRVWRKGEKDNEFMLLQELGPALNSYSDSAVEKNARYVYAINAFDDAGNESPKSDAVVGVIRNFPD